MLKCTLGKSDGYSVRIARAGGLAVLSEEGEHRGDSVVLMILTEGSGRLSVFLHVVGVPLFAHSG